MGPQDSYSLLRPATYNMDITYINLIIYPWSYKILDFHGGLWQVGGKLVTGF